MHFSCSFFKKKYIKESTNNRCTLFARLIIDCTTQILKVSIFFFSDLYNDLGERKNSQNKVNFI